MDYLAWSARDGTPWHVVSAVGEVCSGASDAQRCAEELDGLTATFDRTHCGQICREHALIYTRGDKVGKLTRPADFAAFLAPIDTPMEAYLLARQEHIQHMSCKDALWAAKSDGYLVRGQHMVESCPVTFEIRTVKVAADGTVTVLTRDKQQPVGPCIGRLPAGVAMRTLPTQARAFFAACAELEATSVWAFERMADELQRAGAPAELVARCHEAARDEVRHVDAMSQLAHCHIPTTSIPSYPRRILEDLAVENVVEGCVRELVGAAFAVFQGQHASDPLVRRAMVAIGKDEMRHATLSFAVHHWLASQLDDDATQRLQGAMRGAITGLSPKNPAPGLASVGLPSAAQTQALIDALRPAWEMLAS